MIYNQTIEAFSKLGVTAIETAGAEFNPELHNAVMHIDDEEQGENVIVEELFKAYPTINALADASVSDIESIIRPCGLSKGKSKDISNCMKMLRDEFDGVIPCDLNLLLKLPGVGRKSANLIMGDIFNKPAIVTDTHCIRLCNRIGLVDSIKDPKKVEMELWKIIPPEEGNSLCHRFVDHGRAVCSARTKPNCKECVLADICKYNNS